MAKPARLDLRSVAQVIHTTPDVRPELLLGPGDDASRASYFDAQTTRHDGGPRVIAHRARLTDYLESNLLDRAYKTPPGTPICYRWPTLVRLHKLPERSRPACQAYLRAAAAPRPNAVIPVRDG